MKAVFYNSNVTPFRISNHNYSLSFNIISCNSKIAGYIMCVGYLNSLSLVSLLHLRRICLKLTLPCIGHHLCGLLLCSHEPFYPLTLSCHLGVPGVDTLFART